MSLSWTVTSADDFQKLCHPLVIPFLHFSTLLFEAQERVVGLSALHSAAGHFAQGFLSFVLFSNPFWPSSNWLKLSVRLGEMSSGAELIPCLLIAASVSV